MTVLKEYRGSGDPADPANWETILVGEAGTPGDPGPVGPQGQQGPLGPAGPPPPTVSLTRAEWLALTPPNPDTLYIITDEGGVLLSGTTAPAAGLGYNGDFYLNSATWQVYGPKTTGGWGAPTSIHGAVGPRIINTYSGTAVTAVIGDALAYVRLTGTNPTYTIPPNSAVAFPIGTQIDGTSTATKSTIVAGAGVTIVKARTLVTVGAGSGWTVIKVATDTWDWHGDFADAVDGRRHRRRIQRTAPRLLHGRHRHRGRRLPLPHVRQRRAR